MIRFAPLFQAALTVLSWPARVAEHRRCLAELGGLEDRALQDIGLTRQDLRDATALPLAADPTGVLAMRAAERAEACLRARRRPPRDPVRALPPAWRPAAE